MAFQLSVAVRNAELDTFESVTGTSAILEFWSGSAPANCAAVDSGTLLATLNLPVDWMNNASGGTKTKLGTWSGAVTVAGTAGHFRVKDSTDTTCHAQGTVTITGGGGDLTLDNNVLGVGQVITMNTFTLTAGNA